MKKQFLILTFFVLAIIAGTSIVNGQVIPGVNNSAPRPIVDCDDDALHPMAGVEYTYEAIGTPSGGSWHFWATTDPTFITTDATTGDRSYNIDDALAVGAGELLDASDDYNVNTNIDGTVQITWSASILEGTEYQVTPTFVVAYYVGPDGCADNIKVWELDPIENFIVDIKSIDAEDFSIVDYDLDAPEQCVSIVESALYAAGAMQYDYGHDYIYFEFIGANFSAHWIPIFEIDGTDLVGSQEVTSYEYTTALPSTWGTTAPTWTTLVSGTTQIGPDPTESNTGLGVSIFVRVRIDHNQYENLAGQTLTMTLDGLNSNGKYDVNNADCSLPDPNAPDQNDTAQIELTPRPSVTEGTTSPIAPNEELVPGNEEN